MGAAMIGKFDERMAEMQDLLVIDVEMNIYDYVHETIAVDAPASRQQVKLELIRRCLHLGPENVEVMDRIIKAFPELKDF